MGKYICKWLLGQGFELTQLHSRKTNNLIKNWAKDLNRHFSKEDIQRVQRYMKGCSTPLAIREMLITTTMRYLFTLVRMAIITKSTNKCWWGCREKGNPSTLLVGMQTGAVTVENTMEFPLKTKNGTAFWPGNSTVGIILRILKHQFERTYALQCS